MLIFSIPSSWLADRLSRKEIISRGVLRKSFAAVALFGPVLCLIGLSFTRCNQTLSIVWLCLAVMLSGANNSGTNVCIDSLVFLLLRSFSAREFF